MENDLIRIREEAQKKLAAMREECDLVALQQQLFGKAGELTGILRTMGKLSKEERAQLGASVNKLKQELEAAMEERRAEFRKKAQELRFQQEALDVTEAGVSPVAMGHLHPMTKTYRTIRDALVGMGFQVFDGPEIELDDNNFTLLNLPLDHPARDMQDTFYINDKVLLRTHTSPCEIRALQTFKPPFRFLMPGRVFRVDEVDASHSPVFMQIEGFVVDRNLNLANLKGTLDAFIHAVFGENVKTRLRPSYPVGAHDGDHLPPPDVEGNMLQYLALFGVLEAQIPDGQQHLPQRLLWVGRLGGVPAEQGLPDLIDIQGVEIAGLQIRRQRHPRVFEGRHVQEPRP